jgi:hypothetical protein
LGKFGFFYKKRMNNLMISKELIPFFVPIGATKIQKGGGK